MASEWAGGGDRYRTGVVGLDHEGGRCTIIVTVAAESPNTVALTVGATTRTTVWLTRPQSRRLGEALLEAAGDRP
ncbi:MAG: hypothetical protein GEV09_12685 [Pseudonocardiaceae bacterium]|nr:hypothetical protein [Pseudonocardiaceae bacterium]